MTEQELFNAYALPPSIPARDELLSVLEDCIDRKTNELRNPALPDPARAVLIGWRAGVEWALEEVKYRLPSVIEQADPEWDAKKALMDVAQYADSVR